MQENNQATNLSKAVKNQKTQKQTKKPKNNTAKSNQEQKDQSKMSKSKKFSHISKLLSNIIIFIELVIIVTTLSIINKQTTNIQNKKSIFEALKNDHNNISRIIKEYHQIENQANILKKALPTRNEMINVLNNIEQISNQSQVTTQIHFEKDQPTKQGSKYPHIPIKLTISGNYSQIINFLTRLQNSFLIITINNIIIESPNGLKQSAKGLVSAKLFVRETF